MPYIAEWVLGKLGVDEIFEKTDRLEFNIIEADRIKKLLITMGFVILTGFITPLGLSPFTYMFKVIGGYSSEIILELQKQKITETKELLIIITCVAGILSLSKTKIKFTDICLVVGLIIMSTLAVRNMYIALVVVAFPITGLISSFLKTLNKEEMYNKICSNINRNYGLLLIILLVSIAFSVYNYKDIYKEPYVDESSYPVEASQYIINHMDLSKIKLYNHFNFGSYLEYKGIPTFIDSRSEIYCEEFNNVEILKDFAYFDIDLLITPEEMVEKYGITHFMFTENSANASNMSKSEKYKRIYDDGKFIIFEVIQK